MRIEFVVQRSTVEQVETLQQIPVARLESVLFSDIAPAAYPVLREYRAWLAAELSRAG